MAYAPFLSRSLLSVALMAGLTSCYDDLAPPAAISGSARVARTVEPSPVQATYVAPENPVRQTSNAVDYLNTPNLAGTGNRAASQSANQASIYDGQPSISMDNQMGLASLPAGEQTIAESNSSQPIVDGIGSDRLVLQNGQANAGSGNLWDGQPVVVGTQQGADVQPQNVAFTPANPQTLSQPAPQMSRPNVMPVSEQNCRAQLKRLGGVFQDLPAINDSNSCRIDYPLKLKAVSGDIDVKPDATLNCQMALTFAKWVKSELEPSARLRYLSGVKAIRQMSSYSCRRMNSKGSNPWSEHASGNAIDIGTITLNNGKVIDVRKKGFFAFREKGLLKSVRADSCKYFNTVLGPGSDRHHKDHFHFDLRHRKSGKRYCSL